MTNPPIVENDEWLRERSALLALEKEATQAADRAAAARRRLPMMSVRNYEFEGLDGPVSLLDLFDGRSQLIIQNFMFDPEWDEGCPSCSNLADNVPHLAHFKPYDIAFARVSRAPIEKLIAYGGEDGWLAPWVSSANNTYNQDFGWTRDGEELPGVSVYLRRGEEIFQTYVTEGRGVEPLSGLAGLSRHHALRSPGSLGGLPGRLASDSAP